MLKIKPNSVELVDTFEKNCHHMINGKNKYTLLKYISKSFYQKKLFKKRRQTYNYTMFSKHKSYEVNEVCSMINVAKRTLTENWKKEGLIITNGQINGKDIIIFLKAKLKKKKKCKLKNNEIFCLSSKKAIPIIISQDNPLQINYIDKSKKLQIKLKCYGSDCPCNCSNKESQKIRYLTRLVSYDNLGLIVSCIKDTHSLVRLPMREGTVLLNLQQEKKRKKL